MVTLTMTALKCLAFMPHDVKDIGNSWLSFIYLFNNCTHILETEADKFAEVFIKEKKTMSPALK